LSARSFDSRSAIRTFSVADSSLVDQCNAQVIVVHPGRWNDGRMSIADGMTAGDIETIRICLRAAVDGPYFGEWEFQTLMGVTRGEMRAVLAAWPSDSPEQALAVNNALNNLLGYPHNRELPAPAGQLERILFETRARRRSSDPRHSTGNN
jgi:hypothetical protein